MCPHGCCSLADAVERGLAAIKHTRQLFDRIAELEATLAKVRADAAESIALGLELGRRLDVADAEIGQQENALADAAECVAELEAQIDGDDDRPCSRCVPESNDKPDRGADKMTPAEHDRILVDAFADYGHSLTPVLGGYMKTIFKTRTHAWKWLHENHSMNA
jgi:hypothetical protein